LNFKKLPIETNFWVSNVNNHGEIKPKILDAIASMGEHNLIEFNQKIFNTDWHLGSNYARPYWDIVLPLVTQHHKNIEDCFLGTEEIKMHSYWFQQYKLNDYHGWHSHGTMFSNIYYVALPQSSVTTFSFNKKEFTVEVQEGDIVTFPSAFEHCSKPSTTQEIKTIISYNSFLHS
jgi:hypothetical protein